MKVALVYDRVNKWGGAERVLLALHKIWPEAPLFTAVYDAKRSPWAGVFEVHPSFLQHIPFARSHHEFLPWITPMAFESFDFSGYDVVISVTSAEAKDIITKPGTVHICYCLTPTRYLWSGQKDYQSEGVLGYGLKAMGSTLKKWDLVASSRPDYFISISNHVASRITKYYRRQVSAVIYPPVDTGAFTPEAVINEKTERFFLCVSRLVPYKRVDAVIKAFNVLGWKLKIIGSGSQEGYLKLIAKKNIEFVENLTDRELIPYYQKCVAFVSAADEDFGIVALEAQACGKPVICPRLSGMAETVVEGKTGELFDGDLVSVLQTFDETRYDSSLCAENAKRFSLERFTKTMKETVGRLVHL